MGNRRNDRTSTNATWIARSAWVGTMEYAAYRWNRDIATASAADGGAEGAAQPVGGALFLLDVGRGAPEGLLVDDDRLAWRLGGGRPLRRAHRSGAVS